MKGRTKVKVVMDVRDALVNLHDRARDVAARHDLQLHIWGASGTRILKEELAAARGEKRGAGPTLEERPAVQDSRYRRPLYAESKRKQSFLTNP